MKTYRVFGVKKWVVTVDAENEEEAKMIEDYLETLIEDDEQESSE